MDGGGGVGWCIEGVYAWRVCRGVYMDGEYMQGCMHGVGMQGVNLWRERVCRVCMDGGVCRGAGPEDLYIELNFGCPSYHSPHSLRYVQYLK